MPIFTALAAGAAYVGESVFKYNRKNFMFDNEIRLEREYQGMEMRIKQFELYREDVRDLVDLTVVKMDKYLIVNTLQVGFCITLLTEGRPEIDDPTEPSEFPSWILWVWQMCISGALLYYILSMWLAMHASIAAHSFGVRLLTQFVRLPLPNAKELDDARLLAKDFEASQVKEMLRIPVWKQQLRRLQAAMADLTTDEEVGESESAMEDPQESGPQTPTRGALASSPVAMFKHIRLFRQLQANWQSYDAYARVCMAMGTFQFLQAMAYYSIATLIDAHDVVWPAFACMAVYTCCAIILARLDLYLSRRILMASATFLFLPCLLGFFSVWFAVKYEHSTSYLKDAWRPLMLISYIFHVVWITFTLIVANAERFKEVCLPTKFRAVLYLDVFGWLNAGQDQSTYRADGAAPAGAPEFTMGTEGSERSASSQAAAPPSRSVPSGVHEQLRKACLKLQTEVTEDLVRWESVEAQELLEEDTAYLKEIRRLRESFEKAGQSLDTMAGGNPLGAADNSAAAASRDTVWLKLEYSCSSTGKPIEYWFNCDDDDSSRSTVWEMPEASGPEDHMRISDLRILGQKVTEYATHCDLLGEAAAAAAGRAAAANATVASEAAAVGGPRQQSSGDRSVQSDEVSVAGGLFGGHEAVQLEESDDGVFHGNTFFGTDQSTGPTFQPGGTPLGTFHRGAGGGESQPLRQGAMPGTIPWRTVLIGSVCLICLWSLGVIWIFLEGMLDMKISIFFPKAHHKPELRVVEQPELVFSGPWPHPFFRPEALACHPAASPTILIAERYAIHALRLTEDPLQLRPVLEECLSAVPAMQGRGLAGLTFDCLEGVESKCSAVLLGADGHSAVRCGLRDHESASPSVQRLALQGGHWRALIAAGDNSSLWTLGNDGLTKFSPIYHQASPGAIHEVFPSMDFQHPAAANFSALAVLGNRFLLGLEGSGRLHAWPQKGGAHTVLRLPSKEARWHSLCASTSGIFLAGTRHRDKTLGIYRLDLPEVLAEHPRTWIQKLFGDAW